MKQCRHTIEVLPNKFSQFQSRMKNCVTKRRSVSTERFINQGKCLNCFFCSPLLLCQFSLECVAFLLPDAGFASCTMQWNVQLCNTLSMRGYTHYGLRGHLTQNQYYLWCQMLHTCVMTNDFRPRHVGFSMHNANLQRRPRRR